MSDFTWSPDMVVYHYPCDDGFCCRVIAERKWGSDLLWAPHNYGQAFEYDVRDKDVLFVDYSMSYDELVDLSFKAKSIVILDHHKSAQANLDRLPMMNEPSVEAVGLNFHICHTQNMPDICAHFDMNRCGAQLLWAFAYPDEEEPEFVQRIADRDLFRNVLPYSRRFSLALRSFPMDVHTWNGLVDQCDLLIEEGLPIERFYDHKIDELCETVIECQIGDHAGVPSVNAPWFVASDLAHALLERHPGAPFAAVWYESYGGRTYSLRSTDDRVDVCEVASALGGGGHRNAAGFRIDDVGAPSVLGLQRAETA